MWTLPTLHLRALLVNVLKCPGERELGAGIRLCERNQIQILYGIKEKNNISTENLARIRQQDGRAFALYDAKGIGLLKT